MKHLDIDKYLHRVKDINMMRLLLKAGINMDVRDFFGDTILIRAVIDKELEIAEMLLDAGADVNASGQSSSTALSYAGLHALDLLLKHRAKISDETMIRAVKGYHIDVITKYLDAGANINAMDNKGRSIFRLAILRGDKEITKVVKSRMENCVPK